MSADRDEDDPGARLDAREKDVLYTLFHDPYPWTIAELERELGGFGASDAVAALDRAGLVHRLVVRRPRAMRDVREETVEYVIPTRAARRSDELHEGAI